MNNQSRCVVCSALTKGTFNTPGSWEHGLQGCSCCRSEREPPELRVTKLWNPAGTVAVDITFIDGLPHFRSNGTDGERWMPMTGPAFLHAKVRLPDGTWTCDCR